MSLARFLGAIAEALDAARIPSMLTGSVAAAFRGATRATMDVDLVIDPTPASLAAFVARIDAAGIYVSAEAAEEALRHRTMFNVVDPETGWKADLIVRKARAFSDAEFARREPTALDGVALSVATVEDVILSKLEWARLGASERQIEDVRALVRVAGGELDRAYVERWAEALGVHDAWRRVADP